MSFFGSSTILSSIIVLGQVFSGGNGSQQVTPEMIKQLQSNYKSTKSTSSEFDKYLSDSLGSVSKFEDDVIDSAEVKDSTSVKDKNNKKKLSIYEKMLTGESINPDSLLSTLSIYGYDVFKNSRPSTFAPNNNAAVSGDYPVNADDEIVVMLWGRINEEYKLKVGRDGTINIPRIGPVPVAGLTFEAVRKNINDQVGKIEGVNVTVSMGSLRSIGVYIVGEVVSPGYYTISALSNVTNALFAAGGPTKSGSLRTVQLKRNGQKVASFDFYDFLMSGQDKTGYRLQSGDVIVVPIIQSMAAVVGNVRRNALYELTGKTSLEKLINLAGGLTPSAWTNKIQIERFQKNEHQIILDIDSCGEILPNIEIKDGDIVKILPILDKDNNAVYLTGNVLRPGKFEFKNGMRVKDLVENYNSILPETYLDYAVIYRMEPPEFKNNILPFNLKNVLDDVNSDDNLVLKSKDQIVIYNRDFFEPDRYVFIDGSVTKPGRYKLLDNMKIRDLVLISGGLKDEASPIRGELYRRTSLNMERISTEKVDFCVECAMSDSSKDNQLLRKFDHVFIRSKMGWEEERKVTLKGQIVYPGKYVLYEGETLGDLIKRAGGFKDDAYLAAAVFTRKTVKEFEEKRLEDYSQKLETDIMKLSAEIAAKDDASDAKELLAQQMALKEKLKMSKATGRVVIDIRNEKNYDDFILEDGDEVYVPRNLNTVSVLGEVYNPATFKYDIKNTSATFYIESAGGLNENSDKKHVYIIKANGSIITNKKVDIFSASLEPGDAIVVPQKIRYANGHKIFVESVDAVFKIATLLATIVTLAVALQ